MSALKNTVSTSTAAQSNGTRPRGRAGPGGPPASPSPGTGPVSPGKRITTHPTAPPVTPRPRTRRRPRPPAAGGPGENRGVDVERCEQCGFEGDRWSDTDAIDAVAGLPRRWTRAVAGLTPDEVHRRHSAGTWSIAEYTDHVREVLFAMRFLLDTAVLRPGTDLGPSPAPRMDPEARRIDMDSALAGIASEATALRRGLLELAPASWTSTVTMDGHDRDPRWIVRHAVHDATHHLLDVEGLRGAR